MRIRWSSAVSLALTGMGGMVKNTLLNQKHVAVFSCLLLQCQSLGQKGLNRAWEQYKSLLACCGLFYNLDESVLVMSCSCVSCSVLVYMCVSVCWLFTALQYCSISVCSCSSTRPRTFGCNVQRPQHNYVSQPTEDRVQGHWLVFKALLRLQNLLIWDSAFLIQQK